MICEDQIQLKIGDIITKNRSRVFVRGVCIELTRTKCHFGGERVWFLCPRCEGRIGVLYPVVCRCCMKLSYQSEHESVLDRKYRKAFKVRSKLGQKRGGLSVPFPPKPKRMRWHTYLRVRREAMQNEQQIYHAMKTALCPNIKFTETIVMMDEQNVIDQTVSRGCLTPAELIQKIKKDKQVA